jgi:hypothetical protein
LPDDSLPISRIEQPEYRETKALSARSGLCPRKGLFGTRAVAGEKDMRSTGGPRRDAAGAQKSNTFFSEGVGECRMS